MKKTIAIILILIPLFVLSQDNNFTIKGKVLDRNTLKPLIYANICIQNKMIGITTNIDGAFEFHIPNKYKNDSIIISMLGYKNFCDQICKINQDTFLLLIKPREIKEVIVSKSLSAKQILKKVKKNIEQNYPQNSFYSEGYYREYIKENNLFVRAIEANFGLIDKGFHETALNSLEIIFNTRVSEDYRDRNSIYLINELHWTWYIREFIFNWDKLKYRVDSITILDNHFVYAITGKQKIKENEKKTYQKLRSSTIFGNTIIEESQDTTIIESGSSEKIVRIFITIDKFALVRIESNFHYNNRNPNKLLNNYLTGMTTDESYIVNFTSNNNLWYPSSIHYWVKSSRFKNKDFKKFDKTTQKFIEITINKTITDSIPIISEKEKLSPYDDIYLEGFKYDPKFWENYNFVIDDELSKKVKIDLNNKKNNR